MRIVFMGTPEFAVTALNKLVESNYSIVGVITAPDQAAGRGKKIRQSAVKEYALAHQLNLMQPTNLKDPSFVKELESLKADIQVVVAFRMLPEVVWSMPPKGTFNLHASLLPQYRGAAPINHALINGEKETGVTTFFLDKEIDTGRIILQKKCDIINEDDAESLHDKLMYLGSDLIIETLEAIKDNSQTTISQSELLVSELDLKPAPKIFKTDCKIDWNNDTQKILNTIRGLSPYPAAFSLLRKKGEEKSFYIKIFKAKVIDKSTENYTAGSILTDSKSYFHVFTTDGLISIENVQLEGKKRMNTIEFLRGFKLTQDFFFETLS